MHPTSLYSVLDEATSALSEKSENSLYSKMMDLGITFVSIGQRSSLIKVSGVRTSRMSLHVCLFQFHHQLLTLKTDCSWTLDDRNLTDHNFDTSAKF